MTTFLYAEELKKIFNVFGSYYNLIDKSSGITYCRNLLEIYSNEIVHVKTENSLFFGIPDAIFVMMNPGSSEPREPGYVEPQLNITGFEKTLLRNRNVKAKPDVTQYQVMRIMAEKKWKHVRVVNLSDIREPKSLKFFKNVKEFEKKFGDVHTIFSNSRRIERERAFKMKHTDSPVILGWGLGTPLVPLAVRAMDFLRKFSLFGVQSKKNPLLYSHPSPNIQIAKEKWIKEILRQLKE